MPAPVQSSDIFVKEDIRNILRSILLTHQMTSSQSAASYRDEYSSGFSAAIHSVAVAMDIPLGTPPPHQWYDSPY